jgi:hypothetical protein
MHGRPARAWTSQIRNSDFVEYKLRRSSGSNTLTFIVRPCVVSWRAASRVAAGTAERQDRPFGAVHRDASGTGGGSDDMAKERIARTQ